MRVILYASDHGFGHATRMLALAEALRKAGHAVWVGAGAALPLVRRALRRPALEARLDVGPLVRPGTLEVDPEATCAALAVWLPTLPALVSAEAERIRALGADLVVADAPAAAVTAAAAAGVPAVVCGNFTWLDVHGGPELERALAGAYGCARVGLRLAPGAMAFSGVERVVDVPGVLARRPRRSRQAVRAELGVPESEPLLFLGLGRSAEVRALLRPLGERWPSLAGSLVFAADLLPPLCGRPYPSGTANAQDYLAACDAVVAKAGYSTLAEAALCGVPLLTLPVRGNPESQALCRDIVAQGLGGVIESEEELLRLCQEPVLAIERARAATRRQAEDAGPEIVRIVEAEGVIAG